MAQLAHQFGLSSLPTPQAATVLGAAVAHKIGAHPLTFTRTRQWVHYHEIRQDVLLKVAGIIARHGAGIAFPTRTAHPETAAELAGGGA